jgi:hypothetical protein
MTHGCSPLRAVWHHIPHSWTWQVCAQLSTRTQKSRETVDLCWSSRLSPRRAVREICALLEFYAVWIGSFIRTFRETCRSHLQQCRSNHILLSLQWNQLDALISKTYFGNETLHVSDSSSAHHQELFTVHSAMVYVIEVCRQPSSSTRSILILLLLASCLQTCMTYNIAECTVHNSWWWTEELSETCRVSFQNKFEKLVHLVGLFVRILHDARSHERKK